MNGCTSNKSSLAQASPIKAVAIPIVGTFFQTLAKGNSDSALYQLLLNNENFSFSDSSTILMREKLNIINAKSGRFVDFKLLKEKSIGEYVEMYSYIVRYENKYYRFIFEFYNNGSSTRIYKFLFDDNVDIELEESLKFYSN